MAKQEKDKKKKPKTRRARGTGSIFFHEGRQRWVGRKTVNGVKVERWGETQGEVVKKLEEATPPGPGTTVAAWAERWVKTITVRPSTRYDYRHSLDRHILPHLGSLKLSAVTTAHVERLIAEMLQDSEPGTVLKVIRHARILFGAAVRADLLGKNPVANAKSPRRDVKELEVLTPSQIQGVIRVAQDFAAGGVIATLAAIGARHGEVLALDVGDWDATKGTLRIDKTFSSKFGIGPPKSRHSRRTIRVPSFLAPALDAAAAGRTTGPLFVSQGGRRRSAKGVWGGWELIRKAAKIPEVTIHALRHSAATNMIGAGDPLPDVAKYLGDTVQTIVATYLHPTNADPSVTLDRLYGGRKVGDVPEMKRSA